MAALCLSTSGEAKLLFEGVEWVKGKLLGCGLWLDWKPELSGHTSAH